MLDHPASFIEYFSLRWFTKDYSFWFIEITFQLDIFIQEFPIDKVLSKLLVPSSSLPSKMLVSSAKRVTCDFTDLVRSLMYNKKRIGPRTELCGIPVRINPNLELEPLTCVYWYLSDRYDIKSADTWPLKPIFSSLRMRISWSIVSNGFFKSRKTQNEAICLSFDALICSITHASASTLFLFFSEFHSKTRFHSTLNDVSLRHLLTTQPSEMKLIEVCGNLIEANFEVTFLTCFLSPYVTNLTNLPKHESNQAAKVDRDISHQLEKRKIIKYWINKYKHKCKDTDSN